MSASFVATFLFNALWQLPLLFGAAWAGARLLARAPAAYRHRVWWPRWRSAWSSL